MSIPAVQKIRIFQYIAKNKLSGTSRFPMVLMLEPLFQCNLRCKGCGKIAHPPEIMKQMLSVDECVASAEECGAPVVAIPGGEPLLHPDIADIVRELTERKRFVYLCTNAQIVPDRIDEFTPSPYLAFNVHLDGFADRHDAITCREGVFDKAVDSIKLLLSRGFRVTTNTTLYKGETPESAGKFFDFLMETGVEGMTVSAAFSYENASDQGAFMDCQAARELFGALLSNGGRKRWRFNHSNLYLDFLAGKRTFGCTPWGTPSRSVFGWQRPCYLLEDGYASSFKELMEETNWDAFGPGNDPRCANCMVHCGYEPTAVAKALSNPLAELKAGLL